MFDDYSISHGFNDPLRWWPIERSVMFTDAIFSIIATILIVAIKIPEESLAEVCVHLYSQVYTSDVSILSHSSCEV